MALSLVNPHYMPFAQSVVRYGVQPEWNILARISAAHAMLVNWLMMEKRGSWALWAHQSGLVTTVKIT